MRASAKIGVIGFLALGGLFTTHITGNLVVVAAHHVTGCFLPPRAVWGTVSATGPARAHGGKGR